MTSSDRGAVAALAWVGRRTASATEIAPCAWHDDLRGSRVSHTICTTCAEEQAAAYEAATRLADRSRRRTYRSFDSGAAW